MVIIKYNPNHDELGRFSRSNNAATPDNNKMSYDGKTYRDTLRLQEEMYALDRNLYTFSRSTHGFIIRTLRQQDKDFEKKASAVYKSLYGENTSDATGWLLHQIGVEWAEASLSGKSAVLLQRAVADIFNTGNDWLKNKEQARKIVDDHYKGDTKYVFQEIARQIYAETQKYLAAGGIKEIYAFRGRSDYEKFYNKPGDKPNTILNGDPFKPEDVIVQSDKPLTSWSVNYESAANFARPRVTRDSFAISHILGVRVPAKNIFALAVTGVGTGYEHEAVLIGGKNNPLQGADSRYDSRHFHDMHTLFHLHPAHELGIYGFINRYEEAQRRRNWKPVLHKYNPNHDKDGRFAKDPSGSTSVQTDTLDIKQGTQEKARRFLLGNDYEKYAKEIKEHVKEGMFTEEDGWRIYVDQETVAVRTHKEAEEHFVKAMNNPESIKLASDFLSKFAQSIEESPDRYNNTKDDAKLSIAYNLIVGEWASSTGTAASNGLNLKAAEVFGLDATRLQNRIERDRNNASSEYMKKHYESDLELYQHPFIGAALKVMYDKTQKDLQDAGIDSLVLYRGHNHKEGPAAQDWEQRAYDGNPLSSFSNNVKTASVFGGGLAFMRVPREDIFSTRRSGFGTLYEEEFVVMNRPKKIWYHGIVYNASQGHEGIANEIKYKSVVLTQVLTEAGFGAELYEPDAALREHRRQTRYADDEKRAQVLRDALVKYRNDVDYGAAVKLARHFKQAKKYYDFRAIAEQALKTNPRKAVLGFAGSTNHDLIMSDLFARVHTIHRRGYEAGAQAIVSSLQKNRRFRLRDRNEIGYLRAKSWQQAEKIERGTRNMMAREIEKCIKQGISDPDYIADRLRILFDRWANPRVKNSRAKFIAVTETTNGMGHGFASMLEKNDIRKKWLVIQDGKCCDLCDENGQMNPISPDMPFLSGDFAPPAHPNCRCGLTPILEKPEHKALWTGGDDEELVIRKSNPYHDKNGRFASKPGGATQAQADDSHERLHIPEDLDANEPIKKIMVRGGYPGWKEKEPLDSLDGSEAAEKIIPRAVDNIAQRINSNPAARAEVKDLMMKSYAISRVNTGDYENSDHAREMVSQIIGNWAKSGWGNSAIGRGLQTAAAKEFGLDNERNEGKIKTELFSGWNATQQEKYKLFANHPGTRHILRAMYEETQKDLKESGLTHIVLHRGANIDYSDKEIPGEQSIRTVDKVYMNPLSSFSGNSLVASTFGNAVISERVPISDVLSTGRTGFGTLYEAEFVVMNKGNHKAYLARGFNDKAGYGELAYMMHLKNAAKSTKKKSLLDELALKYNPNHDRVGRFASGPGGAVATARPVSPKEPSVQRLSPDGWGKETKRLFSEAAAKTGSAANINIRFTDMDPDVAKQTHDALKDILTKLPEIAPYIRAIGSSDQVKGKQIAFSVDRTGQRDVKMPGESAIYLNKKLAQDSRELDKSLENSDNWFPPKTNNIRGVLTHELGHSLVYALGESDRENLLSRAEDELRDRDPQDIKKNVSEYALRDKWEFLSECFSRHMWSPEKTDLSSRYAKEMIRMLKQSQHKKELINELALKYNQNHDKNGRFAKNPGSATSQSEGSHGAADTFTGKITLVHEAGHDHVKKIFGKELTPDEIQGITGAPDGAHVTLRSYFYERQSEPGKGQWIVNAIIDHPYYSEASTREFTYSNIGGERRIAKNSLLMLDPQAPAGLGTRIFANQVETLSKLGFDTIKCTAAGAGTHLKDMGYDAGPYNGYYTWPRLGYDGEPGTAFKDIVKGIQEYRKMTFDSPYKAAAAEFSDSDLEAFSQAKTIRDIMKHPNGPVFWKKFGLSANLEFDLKTGSESRQILAKYLQEKSLKIKRLELVRELGLKLG